jgi:hypothetical protein
MRTSSPSFSWLVSYHSTCVTPDRPPTRQRKSGIAPGDEAAIAEAFGSFPTQDSVNASTPLSKPAVTSFSSFLQTSKQSIIPVLAISDMKLRRYTRIAYTTANANAPHNTAMVANASNVIAFRRDSGSIFSFVSGSPCFTDRNL